MADRAYLARKLVLGSALLVVEVVPGCRRVQRLPALPVAPKNTLRLSVFRVVPNFYYSRGGESRANLTEPRRPLPVPGYPGRPGYP
eukprot:3599542-Rhodomonas_salina.3